MKKYVFIIVLLVLMFKFNDIKSHAYANNYDNAYNLRLDRTVLQCFNNGYKRAICSNGIIENQGTFQSYNTYNLIGARGTRGRWYENFIQV